MAPLCAALGRVLVGLCRRTVPDFCKHQWLVLLVAQRFPRLRTIRNCVVVTLVRALMRCLSTPTRSKMTTDSDADLVMLNYFDSSDN